MKYSYNWLKQLSGTKKSPKQLAELLMMRSFEVEEIKELGEGLENVVVGKILDIRKHPGADRLQLTKVDIGKQVLDIVCGAWNIKVGDVVPVALPGAKLPGGLEIKEAEIRGVKSSGMLCASDELGLGTDHSGILILAPEAKIGTALKKHLGLDDVVFDIDVLANRGHDALSHVGMAREIAALENKKIDYDYEGLKLPAKKTKKLRVEVKDKDLCFRYAGAVVENVEIKESPVWLKARLAISGIRPVNNVVDATNYVMLELGQPLHAFDVSTLETRKSQLEIIVRRAKDGEEMKLLDGSVKKLSKDDLVIADSKKPIALAGIMGGEESAITNNTKTIILESANFNASAIRRSRTRLGLQTDASSRFEKEIDPNLAEKAMARTVEIIEHIAGGRTEGVVDIYPKIIKPWKIKLDSAYVNGLLGEKIPAKVIAKILGSLGMKISGKGKIVTAEIPTFRIDLKTQEDLIEEIGRIYGYEKIKPQAPLVFVQPAKVSEERRFERETENILAGQRFCEVYNYSFYSLRDAGLAQLGTVKHLELENPMNPEQALLRVSLIPNLLKNVRENLKNFKEFQIFEVGNVYWPNAGVLPEERKMLVGAVVLAGDAKQQAESFFAIKGHVDALLGKLGISNQYYDKFNALPIETFRILWHEGRSAEIKIDGQEKAIGYLGEINPLILVDFDIHKRVAMFEFDLETLRSAVKSRGEKEYRPLRKYPTVTRDVSMLAGRDVRVDDIMTVVEAAGGDLVLNIELFDIFQKGGETSYAFHLEFGADDRTLESGEVDEIMQKVISNLEKNLKIGVRK